MSHFKETLLRMIHRALSGEWTVDRFTDEYYRFFIDKVPADALSPADEDFFATVQEKMDWTSENPSQEERELGWIDHPEFIQWAPN